jgi:hypothetical protein
MIEQTAVYVWAAGVALGPFCRSQGCSAYVQAPRGAARKAPTVRVAGILPLSRGVSKKNRKDPVTDDPPREMGFGRSRPEPK